MDTTFALFALLGFLAVVLALEGAYNLWASRRSPQARRLAQRLAHLRGDALPAVSLDRAQQRRRLPWLEDRLEGLQIARPMAGFVAGSALGVSVAEVLALSALLAACGLLGGLVAGAPLAGAAGGLALAALPWWRVAQARAARLRRFDAQFADALDLIGRALRAGHAFPGAIRLCGEEMADPIGREFRLLSDEINYGMPVNDALQNLARRMPIPDVSYFVVAVLIQRETGGNLAEVLDRTSALVRQRLKLRGQVRVLSSEGRLSATILTLLPFGIAGALNLVSPGFMSLLWTDPAGRQAAGIALAMMAVGTVWVRRVVRIRA